MLIQGRQQRMTHCVPECERSFSVIASAGLSSLSIAIVTLLVLSKTLTASRYECRMILESLPPLINSWVSFHRIPAKVVTWAITVINLGCHCD